jgi:hypothetical protein
MIGIPYKLLDWINPYRLDPKYLSRNPHAIQWLETNPDKIYWPELCRNNSSFAMYILEKNPDKIVWGNLSENDNPSAIRMLERKIQSTPWYQCYVEWWEDFWLGRYYYYESDLKRIRWFSLSANPGAIHLLEKYPHIIHFEGLCCNSNLNLWAMRFLEKNLDKIDWSYLSKNPSIFAKQLFETYPDKICWRYLSSNSSDWAIQLLKQNPDKISWCSLSVNTHPAISRIFATGIAQNIKHDDVDILLRYTRIDWYFLSRNPGAWAIQLLEKRILEKKRKYEPNSNEFSIIPNEINNWMLSKNPNAIHLLEQNQHRISYQDFSQNPNIFTYDYEEMKWFKNRLHEDLIQTMFHPTNIEKFDGWGFDADE